MQNKTKKTVNKKVDSFFMVSKTKTASLINNYLIGSNLYNFYGKYF